MRIVSKSKREWHKWYAWYPKSLIHPQTGEKITFWLEEIYRKEVDGYFFPYFIYSGYDIEKMDAEEERQKNEKK